MWTLGIELGSSVLETGTRLSHLLPPLIVLHRRTFVWIMGATLATKSDPNQWSCTPGLCFTWPQGSYHIVAEMVGKTTEANKLACGFSATKTRSDESCEHVSVGLKGCRSKNTFIFEELVYPRELQNGQWMSSVISIKNLRVHYCTAEKSIRGTCAALRDEPSLISISRVCGDW